MTVPSLAGFPLALVGLGLRTSFGATAAASVSGLGVLRATSRLRRLGGATDEGAIVCAVRGVRDDVRGRARTAVLAASAMREACAAQALGKLPAVVAVAEPGASEEDAAWLAAVADDVGVNLDRGRSSVLPLGRSGVLLALIRAAEILRGGDAPAAVLVGGVHSCLQPRDPGAVDIPGAAIAMATTTRTLGEAAGFMLLARDGTRAARPSPFHATIDGVVIRSSVDAIAERRRRSAIERAAPAAGEGASVDPPEIEAWRTAFADLGLTGPSDADRLLADVRRASDATGHFLEGARAVLLDVESTDMEWGEQLGDLGAATAFLLVATAVLGPTMGSGVPGRLALAIGASDPRGGVALLRVHPAEPVQPPEERLPAPSPSRVVADAARRELWRHRFALRQLARRRAAEPPPEPPPTRDPFAPLVDDEDLAEEPTEALHREDQDVQSSTEGLDGSLRALAESDLWDSRHLERLDEAASDARRLLAALPSPPEELAPIGDLAMATAVGLDAIRGATIDKAAAVGILRGEGRTFRRELRSTGPDAWGPVAATRARPVSPGQDVRGSASELERALERAPDDVAGRDRAEAELLAAEAAEELVQLRFARGAGPAVGDVAPRLFGVVDLRTLDSTDSRIGRILLRIEALGRAIPSSPDACSRPDVIGAVSRVLPPGDIHPSRAFARALVLGSVDDDEAAFLATQDLCDASELCVDAIADGLALASGGGITRELIARCMVEREPRRIAAALDALTVRRLARIGVIAPLLVDRDPEVRTSATRALGFVAQPAIAAQLLVTAATIESDAAPLASALEALVRCGAPAGLHRARLVLDEREHAPEPFLRLVGLAGDAKDVDRIARFVELPSASAALGWLGATSAIDVLVSVLQACAREAGTFAAPSARAVAAAVALQRITGGLAHGAGPITVGAPRTSQPDRLETRPERWVAFLKDRSHDSRRKLRWGRVWEPDSSLDEIEAVGARREDRAAAQLELAAAFPKRAAALRDPMDRASLQRAAITLARSS